MLATKQTMYRNPTFSDSRDSFRFANGGDNKAISGKHAYFSCLHSDVQK